jgi:hypothetical protein
MAYEKDMQIDESALDMECLEQPRLMVRYSSLQARLEKEEDLAKEALELVKAELDKKIRSEPEEFDIDKITEGSIKSVILSHPRYKKASERYINAKYENNVARGAVKAAEQRKNMLETLSRLHGQQYFAGPKVARDLSEKRVEFDKRISSKISSNLRRRNNN